MKEGHDWHPGIWIQPAFRTGFGWHRQWRCARCELTCEMLSYMYAHWDEGDGPDEGMVCLGRADRTALVSDSCMRARFKNFDPGSFREMRPPDSYVDACGFSCEERCLNRVRLVLDT